MSKVIECIDKKIGILGKGERLFVALPEVGRTYVPKELAFKEGDTLHGTCTVEERTYTQEIVDGKLVDRAVPLTRWELVDYTSKRAFLENAIMDGKIKAASTMTYSAKDLMVAEIVSA